MKEPIGARRRFLRRNSSFFISDFSFSIFQRRILLAWLVKENENFQMRNGKSILLRLATNNSLARLGIRIVGVVEGLVFFKQW